MVLRIFLSIGNLILSLILGAVLIAVVAINSPETLSSSLRWAHSVKEVITGTSLDPKYNVWIEFLLDDRQIVFMGSVVLARILLGLIALPFVLIRGR